MFPTSVQRMVEATGRFFNAVIDKTLTHNGDPDLARILVMPSLKQH